MVLSAGARIALLLGVAAQPRASAMRDAFDAASVLAASRVVDQSEGEVVSVTDVPPGSGQEDVDGNAMSTMRHSNNKDHPDGQVFSKMRDGTDGHKGNTARTPSSSDDGIPEKLPLNFEEVSNGGVEETDGGAQSKLAGVVEPPPLHMDFHKLKGAKVEVAIPIVCMSDGPRLPTSQLATVKDVDNAGNVQLECFVNRGVGVDGLHWIKADDAHQKLDLVD